LSGAYALTPHIDLTARIQDLADTHYQEALGYGEPRRMFFIGFRAKGGMRAPPLTQVRGGVANERRESGAKGNGGERAPAPGVAHRRASALPRWGSPCEAPEHSFEEFRDGSGARRRGEAADRHRAFRAQPDGGGERGCRGAAAADVPGLGADLQRRPGGL